MPHFPLLNHACPLANIITSWGKAGSLANWINGYSGLFFAKRAAKHRPSSCMSIKYLQPYR
jgi:hypothetical protein